METGGAGKRVLDTRGKDTQTHTHIHICASLEGSMNRDSQSEDTLSTMVLENIKNKLIHAFRTTGEPRDAPESNTGSISIGRSYQANEELRRAKIDGAITWLRSELVNYLHLEYC